MYAINYWSDADKIKTGRNMVNSPQESELQGLTMACNLVPAYFGVMGHGQDVVSAMTSMADIMTRLAALTAYCTKRPGLPVETMCLHYLSCMTQVKLSGRSQRSLKNRTGVFRERHNSYLDAAVKLIKSGRAHDLDTSEIAKHLGCYPKTISGHFGSLHLLFVEAYERMVKLRM